MKFLLAGIFALLFGAAGVAAPVGPIPYSAMPNCVDTGGQHLNVTSSTGTFVCGTSGGGSAAAQIVSVCTTTCTITYNTGTATVEMVIFSGGGGPGGGARQLSAGAVAPIMPRIP